MLNSSLIKKCLVVVTACTFVCLVTAGCKHNVDPTPTVNTEATNDNAIENTIASEPTEPAPTYALDESGYTSGIDNELIVENNSMDFYIKNTKTGKIYVLDLNLKHSDMNCDELPRMQPPEGVPEDVFYPDLKAGEHTLDVRDQANKPTNVFVIGVNNDYEHDLAIKDARVVYISYRGDTDWEICGITTDMTRDDILEILGDPSSEYTGSESHVLEYYIFKEGHVYKIGVQFERDNMEKIKLIEMTVDNIPVFVGNTIS